MEKNKRILRALVALSIIPGFGCRRVHNLLKELGDPSLVFTQPKSRLCQIPGIGEASALSILTFDQWPLVDQMLGASDTLGARIIGISDPLYPPLLKQIYDPPVLLWVLGNAEVLSHYGIAVVGTREPSHYGRVSTQSLTRSLSLAGAVIFSGLAYGIDTLAHRTALEHGTKTVAVLGSGIDTIYPRKNMGLARDIIKEGGAVITEFAPGTPPDAGNFPVRNRIVSGLSLGVLIVESGLKGGSMITAELALDQNREVFAVPHSLENVHGKGGNHLIKKGAAKLVQDAEDILVELPGYFEAGIPQSHPAEQKQGWRSLDLDELSNRICEHLEVQALQIDKLSELVDMETRELLVHLLQMEMDGVISQKAGKVFSLQ